MKKIILIETSDIGARYTGKAVRELGFEPLFLCQLSNYQGDTLAQLKEFLHIDIATQDAQKLFSMIQTCGIRQIAGVITFLDSRLEIATELAELLGTAGHEPAILPLKDKAEVYSLIPEFTPPTILVSASDLDFKGICAFIEENEKCILKPRKTAGAVGVLTLTEAPNLQELTKHFQTTAIPEFLCPDQWILQKFVKGELYSLEGFVTDTKTTCLGITGRRKVGNTESVASFPEDQNLPAFIVNEAQQACKELLRRAGIKNSYFHIEFLILADRIFIIDANIGRLGGGGLGELLALSYNISPTDVYRHVIETTLFTSGLSPYNEIIAPSASIFYGVPTASQLLEVKNIQRLRGSHTLILDAPSSVPAMGVNNWSWIGIASGYQDQIFEDVDALVIRTQQGEVPPCY